MARGPPWWLHQTCGFLALQLSSQSPSCLLYLLCQTSALRGCSVLHRARDKQRRPFCRRIDRERRDSNSIKSRSDQQALHLLLAESEPHVPHLLTILFSIERHHVRGYT